MGISSFSGLGPFTDPDFRKQDILPRIKPSGSSFSRHLIRNVGTLVLVLIAPAFGRDPLRRDLGRCGPCFFLAWRFQLLAISGWAAAPIMASFVLVSSMALRDSRSNRPPAAAALPLAPDGAGGLLGLALAGVARCWRRCRRRGSPGTAARVIHPATCCAPPADCPHSWRNRRSPLVHGRNTQAGGVALYRPPPARLAIRWQASAICPPAR